MAEVEKRYIKNMKMLSLEENLKLRDFRVCVIGCGGLGGNIIEQLARLGIGYITGVDGDTFDESNLNRQLLSTTDNMGLSKSSEAKNRVELINPDITFVAVGKRLNKDNVMDIIRGHDIVMDATDNVSTRRIIKECIDELGMPMIHGAIAAWYGQVSAIFPGDSTLDRIYQGSDDRGIETELGNPSFTPAIVAGMQVAECIKVLLNKDGVLRNKLLHINLLDHEYTVMDI